MKIFPCKWHADSSEQWLKVERVLDTFIFESCFKASYVLTPSYTTNQMSAVGKFGDKFYRKDWIMKAKKFNGLSDVAVPFSILELSKEQKYDKFCQLILTTEACNVGSVLYYSNDELPRLRDSPIPGLQQTVEPHWLHGSLGIMTRQYMLAIHNGVIQMHTTIHQNYVWAQMAADVMFPLRSCVPCAKSRGRLLKEACSLKLFAAIET